MRWTGMMPLCLVNISCRAYPRAITIIALVFLSLAHLIVAAITPAAAATFLYSQMSYAAQVEERGQLQLAQNQKRSSQPRSRFNHLKTGFALTGAHRSVKCESCHVRGIFKDTPTLCVGCHSRSSRIATTTKPANHVPSGPECDLCHTPTVWTTARFNHNSLGLRGTPRECVRCHNGQTASGKPGSHVPTTASCDSCHSTRAWAPASAFDHAGVAPGTCAQCHNGNRATGKPGTHVPTTASCDSCHTTTAWKPATFDHGTVAPGTCAQCHNGQTASGKPGTHVPTTASCDNCHTTTAWRPATFDHSTVAPGTCAQCHNGTTASGKPSNHVATTASCDNCHSTTAWLPATFDHSTVAPGTCATCHNGTTASGKPSNHVATTASCDNCHSTTAWLPATFDHTAVAPGTCATCHNGTTATGKSSSHFVTTRSCDACHSTTSWLPTLNYSHTSPFFPGGHPTLTCIRCHTTNSEVISWQFAAYKPDCAGCHADDYKPEKHKKTNVPTRILYTVGELKDCSGSCHEYTDNTFTTILKTRSGKHSASKGGW
jgi:hypothetical protein